MKIADLLVTISANSKGLRSELAAVKRNIKDAFGTESMKLSEKVGSKFKWIAAAAAALGIASVKMNADMEMTTRAFEVLTGSAEKAKEHIAQLESFAATTPFELPGLLDASKKLQAYGFQVDAVIPIMRTVGDAAMAVGLGQEGIDRITLALGQMNAKGKVSAEEMRQLAETGLPAWEMLAKGIGVSVPEAMDMASKGAINAKAGITALLTGLDSKFNGMMEKVAGEIPQSFSNMQDSVKSIMRTIGADITKTFDLKTKMKGAADWLSEFSTIAKSSGIREAFDQMVPDSVKTAIVGISAAIVGIAVPALAMLAISVIAATWPLLAIGVAFGTAAALIYANWDSVGPFWTGLWDSIVSITQWAWEKLSSIFTSLSDAYHWLDNKITTVINKAMSVAGIDIKIGTDIEAIGAKKAAKETEKAEDKVWSLKKACDSLNSAGGIDKAAAAAAKKAQKAAEAAAKKQQREYDRLVEKAKDTSDRIEDEWIQLTGTKMDALEKWRRDEIKTLNETKSVNENYQRDMTRLEETYAEKRRKILQNEAQEKQRIYEEITTGYSDLFATLYSGGLKGSPKDLFDMAQSARDDYKSAKDFFARINAEYENGTKKQKEDIIEALDAAGVAYKKTGQDGLDFTKSLYDYELERFRQLQDEKVDYFRQCKDIQSNIDEAYNKNSLTQLKAVLTKENALRLASYEAQRAAMDLYYDSWAAANISTSHQITNVLDDMRGSFKTLFSDLITGSQSFGETLLNFFEDLANNIVDSFAEKWSNQIVNGMMGWFDLGGEKQGGGLLGGSVLSGAAGGGGMLGGLGGIFGGGFNIGGIFGGLGETTATLNDTMGAFGETVLSNTGDMGLLGGAVQGGAGLMRGFNVVQGMINATTKPTEAATTAAATAALSALTPAAISAAAALNSVGSSGLFGGIFRFATGGPVFGAGSATSDSIPAMLSNGEYVMNASAVDRFGLGFFNRLNNGELPALAEGGLVTGPSLSSVGVRSYTEPAGRETAGGGIGKKEAVETVAEQQPSVNMSVYAMDAKSFEGWLEDTGGKPLEKFMKSRRREFALLGG